MADAEYKAEKAHERLDEHEEVHDHHDRRISTNENWRLQAQGAFKVLAFLASIGALGYGLRAIGLI